MKWNLWKYVLEDNIIEKIFQCMHWERILNEFIYIYTHITLYIKAISVHICNIFM